MSWWRRFIQWLLRLLGRQNDRPKPVSNMILEIDMSRATLNWTLPTTREGGALLDVTEITGTEISMSADGGVTFSPVVLVTAIEPQTFVVDNLTAGDYVFRATVVDTGGRRSTDADVTGSVLAPPSPIADLSVTIT